MHQHITIREARTESDIRAFWEALRGYQQRDIFPDPADEDRSYFLSGQYREQIQTLHDRPQDRLRWLFFSRGGEDIGFAMPVVYETEDGKCFILEFCVFPRFRGGGTGRACARALLDWARANGGAYAELNNGGDPRRIRFWRSLGFVPNGADEWGQPLMLLPPEERRPFSVDVLADGEDWQLHKLLNGFLAEIGEGPLDDGGKGRLAEAVEAGRIIFFAACRESRAIGLCSVSLCFSTFACRPCAVFDDFYVEPAFRGQGAARLLASAARQWCREHGCASLTVGCSEGDAAMYRSLGFDTPLGVLLASNM